MAFIAMPVPHPTRASLPLLARTASLDLHALVQQDPLHIDLAAHPTALCEQENLQCLTAHLLQFGAVESLNLSNAAAGADVLDHVIRAAEAGAVAQLHHLRLRATHLTSLQLDRLLPVLKTRAPLLACLDVSDNGLDDTAIGGVAAWLPPSLETLQASANSFSAPATTQLLVALRTAQLPMLTTLELSGNRLDSKACAALSALLTTTAARTTLTTLGLAHCGLDDVTALCVAEALHTSAVEVLDLAGNDCLLCFVFAMEETRPVSLPSTLRILCLAENACKRSAVVGFAQALQDCHERLEGLFLSRTLAGDVSLSSFLGNVGDLPALRVLDLSHCGLTYRSGKVLSLQLPASTQLEELRLSDNMLEAEGVMDFLSGLERMCRLTYLDLGSSYLGNCGAVAVVTSLLRSCAPVEYLDLSDNGINDGGFRDVCKLLSRFTCPRLRRLVVSRNACTKEMQNVLHEMMQGRQSSCHVVTEETPLEEQASSSCHSSTPSSTPRSIGNPLLEKLFD